MASLPTFHYEFSDPHNHVGRIQLDVSVDTDTTTLRRTTNTRPKVLSWEERCGPPDNNTVNPTINTLELGNGTALP